MSVLITICARGGSKGVPGKNIKMVDGKPLIGYSIDVAKEFQRHFFDAEIALSTDLEEIKKVAAVCGLLSDYIRPNKLAGDSVGKIDTIADVLDFYEVNRKRKFDYVLDLDVTSPLRNVNDLLQAFVLLRDNAEALNLFSVSPASRSPYFNMVEQKENGFYAQVRQLESAVFTRQSAPVVYDLNASFYFYKREFFELGYNGAITDRSLVYVVPHICFDLDHPIDFEFMSYLIANDKLDFEL